MKKRLTLSISGEAEKEIKVLADKKNISSTEVIKRALALYFVVDKELSKLNNGKIAITDNNKIITSISYISL